MTNISTFLSDTYIGAQGIQGTYGSQGVQGSSPQGLSGTISTTTNVGLVSITQQSYIFTQNDVGKFVGITTGGGTISANSFLPGDVITIFNDSTTIQDIFFESGINFFISGNSVGFTTFFSLADNQICNVLCVNTNKFIVY